VRVGLTCEFSVSEGVSEGGFEPPRAMRPLGPQGSDAQSRGIFQARLVSLGSLCDAPCRPDCDP
jgi:hypothetical protein